MNTWTLNIADAIRTYRPRAAVRAPATAPFTPIEIAEALEHGEFEPFFQPRKDLETGRIVGVEAFARWRHPAKGLLHPASFLGPIEEYGLMGALSDVMLDTATSVCRLWRCTGLRAGVSINLSFSTLGDADLADRIAKAALDHGLEASSITLDIPAWSLLPPGPGVITNLTHMRAHGFRLAIDDFGAGASTMLQLAKLPFTDVKVDRALVQSEGPARAAVRSSLEIARALGIITVAEGVETREQLDLMRELGCQHAQGTFVARPLDAGAFLNWARNELNSAL